MTKPRWLTLLSAAFAMAAIAMWAAPVAAAKSKSRLSRAGVLRVAVPKPGSIEVVEVEFRVNGATRAHGRKKPGKKTGVPRLKLARSAKLPRGTEIVGGVARLTAHAGVYLARVVVLVPKSASGARTARRRVNATAAQDLGFSAVNVQLTSGGGVQIGNRGVTGASAITSFLTTTTSSAGGIQSGANATQCVTDLAVGDFSASGLLDIASTDPALQQFSAPDVLLLGGDLSCDPKSPLGLSLVNIGLAGSTVGTSLFTPLGRPGGSLAIPLQTFTATSLVADFDGIPAPGVVNDIAIVEQNFGLVFVLLNPGSPSGLSVGGTLQIPDLFSHANVLPTSATAFRDAHTGLNDLAITDISTPTSTTGSGQIIVGINTGPPSFFDTFSFRRFVATPGATNILNGDFNNDGIDDLAYIDFESNFAALALNDGTNFFLTPQFRETGGFVPVSAVAGDFNDDNNLDLVVLGHSPGSTSHIFLTTLLGNGAGQLTPGGISIGVPNFDQNPPAVDANHVMASVALGRLDGDVFQDIVVATGSGLQIFDNQSTATTPIFTPLPPLSTPAGSNTVGVLTADVNGDGRPDLIALNRGTGTISTFLALPSGGFAPPVQQFVGANPIDFQMLNLDGHADLVVLNGPLFQGDNDHLHVFADLHGLLVPNGSGAFTHATNLGSGTGGTTTTGTGGSTVSGSTSPLSASIGNSGAGLFVDAGGSLSFSGSASGGTAPYADNWLFGDGGTSSVQNPTHTFPSATNDTNGRTPYNVSFTVTDANGKTANANVTVIALCTGITVETVDLGLGPQPSVRFCGRFPTSVQPVYWQYEPVGGSWTFNNESNIFETLSSATCPTFTTVKIVCGPAKPQNENPTVAFGGTFGTNPLLSSGNQIKVTALDGSMNPIGTPIVGTVS